MYYFGVVSNILKKSGKSHSRFFEAAFLVHLAGNESYDSHFGGFIRFYRLFLSIHVAILVSPKFSKNRCQVFVGTFWVPKSHQDDFLDIL